MKKTLNLAPVLQVVQNIPENYFPCLYLSIDQVWWFNLINLSELFIIRKYVKIRFKNRGSPWYFLSSRDQQIKKITKNKQKWLFLYTFLASFFMAFLSQKLIYTINTWFNFVLGSFFKQNHLLNLIILGDYAKRWPIWARTPKQKLM